GQRPGQVGGERCRGQCDQIGRAENRDAQQAARPDVIRSPACDGRRSWRRVREGTTQGDGTVYRTQRARRSGPHPSADGRPPAHPEPFDSPLILSLSKDGRSLRVYLSKESGASSFARTLEAGRGTGQALTDDALDEQRVADQIPPPAAAWIHEQAREPLE